MCRSLRILILILILLFSSLTSAQTEYPGTGLFSYECRPDGILFLYRQSNVMTVSFPAVARALGHASERQKNQLITATREVGLWALKSNEIQIHIHTAPEQTKLIFPPDICQSSLPPPPSANNSQAFAIVQVNGVGRAFAYAEVTESGEARAVAQGTGNGVALAFAVSAGDVGSDSYYVVQKGDNLYRIAQRYSTTVDVLAQLNNLSDPTAILVGQVIILP